MRGWTSILGGMVMAGLALWLLSSSGANTTAFVFGAGALILFYRGYQGLTLGESADDAMMPMEFVSDPRGTILEIASDQVGNWMETARNQASTESGKDPSFDPDAVIARYMEQRAENPLPAIAPPPAPRGFGRKGL